MEFQEVKKQIKEQTRPPLDHVYVPHVGGYVFQSDSPRVVAVGAVLRYTKKIYVLKRDGYRPSRDGFMAWGGDFTYIDVNSHDDGSMRDGNIASFANVEYATGFIPLSDGTVTLPCELSPESYAKVYVFYGHQSDNVYTAFDLGPGKSSISFAIRKEQEVRLIAYYYNSQSDDTDGVVYNGFVNLFAGIGQYVGQWSYVDVYPPSTPQWSDTALQTYAADPAAGTSKITLSWKSPVQWATVTDPRSPDIVRSSGVLIDADIAGHNIYRISYSQVSSGNGYRGLEGESPNTVVYTGVSISSFSVGSEMTSSAAAPFVAQMNGSTTSDGGIQAVASGSPTYVATARLGQNNRTQEVVNPDFKVNALYNTPPSGWTVTLVGGAAGNAVTGMVATGVVASVYHSGTTGYVRLSQDLVLNQNIKYTLAYDVFNVHSGVTTIGLYDGVGTAIHSFSISGAQMGVSKVHTFTAPSGATLAFDRVGSGIAYVRSASVVDTTYYQSIGAGSSVKNHVHNGGFVSGIAGWSLAGLAGSYRLSSEGSFFGPFTPQVICTAPCLAMSQLTQFPSSSGTLSCYLNVTSGVVAVQVGLTPGILVSGNTSGWQRYACYYPAGISAGVVVVSGMAADTHFMIDGVMLEDGRRVSWFNDVNTQSGVQREAAYLSYPASGVIDTSIGTIRLWYSPGFKDGDYFQTPNHRKTIFKWYNTASPTTSGYILLAYDVVRQDLIFGTYATLERLVGYKANFTNRNEWHQVVAMWSGTWMEVWIDGKRQVMDSSFYNVPIWGVTEHYHPYFYVGGSPDSTDRCADGAIDGLIIDKHVWTAQDIIADYRAVSGYASPSLTVASAKVRRANLVQNSNFELRTSLVLISGWTMVSSGTVTMSGSYNKPFASDAALHIKVT